MVSRRTYFSVINNAIYVSFGPVLTILGAYMMAFYKRFQPAVEDMTWQMPMTFMILGIITILVAIFACLQLATEFALTAVCYFIIVVLLILLLIGTGAFWVNVNPNYPAFLNDTFDRAYNSFQEYQVHQSWTVLQSELQCCGLNGMSDFERIHTDIPIECCANKTVKICSPSDAILDGCIHSFLYRVYLDRYLIGTVAILAGALMLLMLIGSVFVCFEEDEDELGDDGECEDGDYGLEGGAVEYVEEEEVMMQPGASNLGHQEKHPAFAGVDLTYVPDHAPPQQPQETIIVQPAVQSQPIVNPIPPPPPPPVVVEEVNSTAVIPSQSPPPNPQPVTSPPVKRRLVRVVRKLPMFETRSRMRYCVTPTASQCRRCSHVSKCKRRQRMSLLDTVATTTNGSQTSMQARSLAVRRGSQSPPHVIMEAPKINGRFICRKSNGRTICRATTL